MKEYKWYSFLQEEGGKVSNVRIWTGVVLLLLCFVVIHQVVKDNVDHGLIGELLVAIFGAKVYSKTLEVKNNQPNGKDAKANI